MTTAARHVLSEAERIDWLRLIRTPQVGAVTFHALIARYGSAGAALDELPRIAARAGRQKPPMPPSVGEIQREIDRAAKLGARYLAAC